ncbi:hypothetical protein BD626DRAFT_23747 [Schizophyllum amplum]|uniref:Uncharacterized protein n=1 Tax=Schizophyllum amplum TaxID=97359 RepID=A0A550CZB0_9AGAR|nr:hypothetical protein BD626DRAFT_23747 [Auriculariopsis ampla]
MPISSATGSGSKPDLMAAYRRRALDDAFLGRGFDTGDLGRGGELGRGGRGGDLGGDLVGWSDFGGGSRGGGDDGGGVDLDCGFDDAHCCTVTGSGEGPRTDPDAIENPAKKLNMDYHKRSRQPNSLSTNADPCFPGCKRSEAMDAGRAGASLLR